MKNLITAAIFVSLAFISFAQDTIYVPFEQPTIQAGIDVANDGDLVLVTDGTYIENINFNGKGITVASYFLVDGNESHIQNTIIDGSQPADTVFCSTVFFYQGEDTNSVLCGFTITGGTGTPWGNHQRTGGGILIYNSAPIIRNNIIEFNKVESLTGNVLGSAMKIEVAYNKTVIIENNIIRNNLAKAYGASAFVNGTINIKGTCIIRNNTIIDNLLSGTYVLNGGGIDAFGVNNPNNICYIENNIIARNNVESGVNSQGGGIYAENLYVVIKNNIIANNSANVGGGIFYRDDLATPAYNSLVANNTIIGNTAQYYGGALSTNEIYEITNCIIWGNSSPPYWGTAATITYSDIEETYTGVGNISIDPEIEDTVYFIPNSILCIDAGNPDAQYNDLAHPYSSTCSFPPACGTLRNDMGHFGGPASLWCYWEWPYSIDLPSVPTLVSPSGNMDTTEVEFVWTQCNPFVLRYWFEIDTTNSFTSSFIDSLVTDTTYLFSNLEYGKEYWWRVRAHNIKGWGEFSEVGSLIVVSVESDKQLPTEFALEQNYPNPFNPSTKIKYSVPQSSNVELKVFDILGNEIETLVNEEKPVGTYEVTWYAEQLPSGVYFYQLKAGNFIETKKMLLLK